MKKTIYYIMIGCLLLGTGCSDWLSVNPKDKVEQKEMFSDENGFKNALIDRRYLREILQYDRQYQ